jgi:hypothetical protein
LPCFDLGGGRKVVRVEISLNDGESWRLCKVTHPSPCTKYGKYWCWNLWEVEVDLIELLQAKEIVVRAWDFAMNTQPQKITWNLMVSSACCSANYLLFFTTVFMKRFYWQQIS